MSKIIDLSKPTKLTQDQIEIIDVLRETLAQALEGNFHAIGIVVCMNKGYAHTMRGRNAADLNLGCDSLKREILDTVETAGANQRMVKN